MHELPENPNEWPADPFAILGVSRSSDATEIRRAWFQLVRRFHPDRFPEQFQRLRAAYERAVQWGNHRQSQLTGSDRVSPSAHFTFRNDPSAAHRAEPGAIDPKPEESRKALLEDDLLQLLASRSQADVAQRLSELDAAHPGNSRLTYCRYLFHFLHELQSLKNGDTRLVLLFELARDERYAAHTSRWLEWELISNPALARSTVWNELMAGEFGLSLVWPLVEARWRTIGWLHAGEVMRDIKCLEQIKSDDDALWEAIQLRSVEYTTWRTAPGFREHEWSLRDLLAQAGWKSAPQQDRLEELRYLGLVWRKTMAKHREGVLGLAPFAATLHPQLFAEQALPWCRMATEGKLAGILQSLDSAAASSKPLFRVVVNGLGEHCRFLQGEDIMEDWCDPRLVHAFFGRQRRSTWQTMRLPLLEYCRAWGVSVEAFCSQADALHGNLKDSTAGSWSMAARLDPALRLVELLAAMPAANACGTGKENDKKDMHDSWG